MNDITLVTGLFDIGRGKKVDQLAEYQQRPFKEYLRSFERVLALDVPMCVYIEPQYEDFVWKNRDTTQTSVIVRDLDYIRTNFPFYNEVQRIKSTITKINDGRRWLILIDELFKGTNVEDAMKCSSIVIEGLIKIPESIFILSTHLYEIGESLKKHTNISFNYFETQMINEEFSFSYQLKNGISNDRLGYLILKKEGVVEMLERSGPL